MAGSRRRRPLDLDRKSVVMLDHLVERYAPHSWPVSAIRETEGAAREVRQVDGAPPILLSRAEYEATPSVALSVLNVRTGATLPARVYRLTRRGDV